MFRLAALLLFLASLALPARAEAPREPALAFVILAQPKMPSGAAVRDDLQRRLGKSMTVDGMEEKEDALVLRVAGGTLMVGLMKAPIPNQELDRACKQAWYWKEACDVVVPHRAHLIVALAGTRLDKVDAALVLTQAASALMGDDNALAGYWSGNLRSRKDYLSLSPEASRQALPTLLWIGYRASRSGANTWSMSTHGMQDFGFMEIEAKDAVVDPGRLFNLIVGTSVYLLRQGPVIQDGDTIGESPQQKIRVRHGPSYWTEGRTVYRIVFDQP